MSVPERVRGFLAAPPAGAAALRLERLRRETIASVLDDFAGQAIDAVAGYPNVHPEDTRSPGLRLVWADASGAALARALVHPVPQGFEDAILPACFHAAAHVPAEVQVWCESGTLADGPRCVDRWDPRDPLRAAVEQAGYREGGPTAAQRAALEALRHHGWTVESAGGAIEARRTWRKGANPVLLLLLLPYLFFLWPFWLLRMAPGFWDEVGRLWRAGTRGTASELRYTIDPAHLRAASVVDGDGAGACELPLAEIAGVGFAPRGPAWADAWDAGALRVIGYERTAALPHTPGGLARVTTTDTVRSDRAAGRALADLVRATVAARRP